MDRETRRLIEEFRRNEAGPIENNLIDELVGGELDRQEFLRRATMFGLSVGTIGHAPALRRRGGVALGATAAVAQGGRHDPRRPDGVRLELEPYLLNDGGSLALRRHPGRVPHVHEPEGAGRAVARHELEAEHERDRVDVPAPQGRQVPQRQDDDRRRTSSRA